MTSHIKTFLSPLLQKKEQNWKISILAKWPEIMGNLANHVSIEKIQDDSIILGVQNSSWLQELYLMGPTILETINKNLDQPRFKTIRFKQRGSTKHQKKEGERTAPTFWQAPVTITDAEQRALDRITDSALKDSLHAFLVRCHREKKR
ncbi:MAG TPA: DUF721 domain-containing protein [Candidatus Babeliales bacterium]|nr:DUF721 domain-containing protein [Candidatus Babeliales bacterium]